MYITPQKNKITSIGLLFISVLFIVVSTPTYSADYLKLAQTAYEKHIVPGYKNLVVQTKALEQQFDKFCQMPKETGLKETQIAYKNALVAWARVEHIHFGPVSKKYRRERFAYWPDLKGRGLRQVRRVIASQDKSVLSLETLESQSIAMQGLTALEYLLYGNKNELILSSEAEGKFRCDFSKTIAKNLAKMSSDILKGWQPETTFTDAFLRPGPKKIYITPQEVTKDLFQAYEVGLEQTRNLKVLRPAGRPPKGKSNYKKAAYWRSNLSLEVIEANFNSLKDFFVIGGFSEFTAKKEPHLEQQVIQSMDNGLKMIARLKGPISEILSDKKKTGQLRFLVAMLNIVRAKSGLAILKVGGLTIAFNAEDGD